MRIRVYSNGKFYLTGCPDGPRVVRRSARSVPDSPKSHGILGVNFRRQELATYRLTRQSCRLCSSKGDESLYRLTEQGWRQFKQEVVEQNS
jgi:hypothetical protein